MASCPAQCSCTFTSASQHTLSPIFKLHYDLLWLIFIINTELEGHFDGLEVDYDSVAIIHPLTTARWTSQVCRQWRSLIVESPTIWSNVVELGLLVQTKDHWRNEVIGRTGLAGLCVSGWVDWNNPISVSFFEFLLVKHWDRTQKLEVEFRNLNTVPEHIELILNDPAPNLNHICIWFSATDKIEIDPKPLKHKIPIFPTLERGLHFPWTGQLRSIFIACKISVHHLLSILSYTPMLETLEVRTPVFSSYSQARGIWKTQKLALPRLSLLILKNRFDACLDILECVIPSSHCVLRLLALGAHPKYFTKDHNRIATFKKILQKYSTSYFASRNVHDCNLRFSQNGISIDLHLERLLPIQSFAAVVNKPHTLPSCIFSASLQSISSVQLSSITTMYIQSFGSIASQDLHREFMDFASGCHNIEVIRVDKDVAALLCVISGKTPTLFPVLHTLKVETWFYSVGDVKQYAFNIFNFLKLRRNSGRPITLLDIVCSKESAVIENWNALAEVNVRQSKETCTPTIHAITGLNTCIGCAIAKIVAGRKDLYTALDAFVASMKPRSSIFQVSKYGKIFWKRVRCSWKKFSFKGGSRNLY